MNVIWLYEYLYRTKIRNNYLHDNSVEEGLACKAETNESKNRILRSLIRVC